MVNDSVATARVLMCLLAITPPLVGYYWARYYDYFPRHSLRQIASLALVLTLLLGTVPLQYQVYFVIGHLARGDRFTQILIIIQYFLALAIFFAVLTRREKTKRRSENISVQAKERR